MLNPNLSKVLQNGESRYSLVIATARRAREISEIAEVNREILLDKPVSIAINELIDGKYKIVEAEIKA